MEPPRILIVCTWFPPVNAPGARRPYRLARQLLERGWQVSVLTSTPEGATEPYGTFDGARILRTPRTAATFDLNAVQQRLLRSLDATRGTWVNGPLRVLADLALPFRHHLRWDLSPASIEAELGAQDIVVATSPDPTVFDIGARLARHWNATWAVDYRDPWNVAIPEVAKDIITHQGTGLAGALRRSRMRRLERRFCGHADLITAVSKAFLANALAITGNTNGAVVHGGSDIRQRPGRFVHGERFILTHTGQLYPEQPWEVFFDALHELRRAQPTVADRLRVRFVGAASTSAAVMRRLEQAEGSTGLIERVPEVGPEKAIALQQGSDALLQLALTGRKGYLPVKFLEYLGARRPILLLSSEQDEMEEALMATRAGTIVRSGEALVSHLVELVRAHAAGRQGTYEPDEQALSLFDYARNMDRWADLLETASGRR
jgi:hypothetical protein